MARNGVAGFVNASAMVPGGSAFALDVAAGATVVADDDVYVVAGATAVSAGVGATADGAGPAARPPMRWTANTSGFVLRRMKQLIESGARADKGFKDKEVNMVAK